MSDETNEDPPELALDAHAIADADPEADADVIEIAAADVDHVPEADPRGYETLIESIRRSRGFDFSGYKTASLTRRFRKRMATVGLRDFAEYTDYLEVHPEEFALLFNTVLINVTAFFRDPNAWEYLAREVVPGLIKSAPPGDPIRVWSAGCASGEEAYTLAILLAEALGHEAFSERVKVYATDVDEASLSRARQALYEPDELEGIPPALRDKYFERVDHRYGFLKEFRRSVIFGRHDLVQDAPISRIDLLVCRNTLMYFNAETQSRILERFHFALNDHGIMFLGKAETLLAYSTLFAPVDLKRRVFARVPRENLRGRVLAFARTGNGDVVNHLVNHVRLREAVFEAAPVAQFVVDQNGILVLANERARALFRLSTGDVGRPLQDLEVSYKPADLRSCIDRVSADRRPETVRGVEWVVDLAAEGLSCYLDIQVFPLSGANGVPLGTSVTFTDVTGSHKLQADLQAANQELEAAYEELQSTNEELETTNEELQSTVEELETTNEELQSSNEELETMNEELQSTNEELHTLNVELRDRGVELDQVNDYLESILRSMRGGVVVVDRDLLIQIWNHKSEDFWGLRSAEVIGKPLMNLDIGLPVERLKPAIRSCLADEGEVVETEMEATNRRGKMIRCKVTCSPLRDARGSVKGVILVMSEPEV